MKNKPNPSPKNTNSKPAEGGGGAGAKRSAGGAILAPPPASSGATIPRLVTRGESFNIPSNSTPANAAITDWLNCTFLMPTEPESLNRIFGKLRLILGDEYIRVLDRGRGHLGWTQSFDVGIDGAIFAVGGQRGKALLQLPGGACTGISKSGWVGLVNYLDKELGAKITRWDGAVDDYEGTHSVNWAVKQFFKGEFSTGGNRPSCNQHGNWLRPDGRGRTFEVGRRKNGKMIRIYEKGKQLGNPASPWVRWEVELHSRDRHIPWDVVLNPGPFVAGAYDATKWISEETNRVKTFQKSADISYNALTHHLSNGYGPMLNVMLAVEGSPEKVLSKLIRSGKPRRLELPVPAELKKIQNAKDSDS